MDGYSFPLGVCIYLLQLFLEPVVIIAFKCSKCSWAYMLQNTEFSLEGGPGDIALISTNSLLITTWFLEGVVGPPVYAFYSSKVFSNHVFLTCEVWRGGSIDFNLWHALNVMSVHVRCSHFLNRPVAGRGTSRKHNEWILTIRKLQTLIDGEAKKRGQARDCTILETHWNTPYHSQKPSHGERNMYVHIDCLFCRFQVTETIYHKLGHGSTL